MKQATARLTSTAITNLLSHNPNPSSSSFCSRRRGFSAAGQAAQQQQQPTSWWPSVVRTRHDRIDAKPIVAFARAMDYDQPQYDNPAALPWGWHHFFCLPNERASELGEDGHERWHAPPAPFVHRMWGGATIEWPDPSWSSPFLMVGDSVMLEERLADVKTRKGVRGGDMMIVTLQHRLFKTNNNAKSSSGSGSGLQSERQLVMTENRSLVYRKERSVADQQSTARSPDVVHDGGAHLHLHQH